MDIDIERLATDLYYWNEVAPEGAECFIDDERFVKWVDGVEHDYYECGNESWGKVNTQYKLEQYTSDPTLWKVIMKPTPTAWNGEGQPPIGTVCEARCMVQGNEKDWFKTTVRYLSEYTAVVDNEGDGEIVAHPNTMRFRPLRTPEQIQRDEICNVFRETTLTISGNVQNILADALVKAGYHK